MKVLIAEKLSQHRYKTPEGYLICVDSVLARTGKQTYRRNEIFTDSEDDRLIEVDRKAEEVFSPETMASFENKPICVEHPEVDVTVDNISEFAVGFVRDIHKGEYEGEPVMLGTLVITDAKTIEEIENGEHTDLSCGYDCDIEDCDSPEQKHIRGNHIALCEHGRAGIAHIVDSVNDMALSRTDAMDRCISLGKRFIEHFDKVYKNPNDSARNHWLSEMNAWWKSVKEIKLKNTNKPPLNGEYRDWFFTAGANPEDFMKAPTYMESKSYDDFVNALLNGVNMESAVKQIKFTDKLVESSSKEAFNKNVATEIKAGKDPKQAVAIAYSVQRKNDEESTYTEVTKNLEKEADKDMKWLDTVIGEKKEEIKDAILSAKEERELQDYARKFEASYPKVLAFVREKMSKFPQMEAKYWIDIAKRDIVNGKYDSPAKKMGYGTLSPEEDKILKQYCQKYGANYSKMLSKIFQLKKANPNKSTGKILSDVLDDIVAGIKDSDEEIKDDWKSSGSIYYKFERGYYYIRSIFNRNTMKTDEVAKLAQRLNVITAPFQGTRYHSMTNGGYYDDYTVKGKDKENVIKFCEALNPAVRGMKLGDSNEEIKDYVPFPAKDDLTSMKITKEQALSFISMMLKDKENTVEDSEGMIYLTQKAYNEIKAAVKNYGITQKELEGISRYFFGPGGYNMFR